MEVIDVIVMANDLLIINFKNMLVYCVIVGLQFGLVVVYNMGSWDRDCWVKYVR